MPRRSLSPADSEHGRRLGAHLARIRQRTGRSAQAVATEARLSVDTVRSVETGRVPTPAFLTVARLASVLGESLDDLHAAASDQPVTSERSVDGPA
ncbi:helix-turn-helix domain-containing protein [Blastococcus sp. MG754426]|uniref:helix-turn-helix domain-containing protein n=1 Tax=unclassified Blastococcus TaxID=2619396 RepID=UPI001EEF9C84|nr:MULTISPECIES: helix-turn-helix transcriptional regulator [unclassified Blastococcus]MCF6506867.1 helix-turn-helix domain-containing protein [Blastococcus sp. MG754426]MCF6511667.1 helix-turn-helix domain-containing protein [Blastococcus sp. MG754427]